MPATPAAEETVEVVRNHVDGTRSARVEPSLPEPDPVTRGDARRPVEPEWTPRGRSMEGRRARCRASGGPTNPKGGDQR